jgi:hypothetical protein
MSPAIVASDSERLARFQGGGHLRGRDQRLQRQDTAPHTDVEMTLEGRISPARLIIVRVRSPLRAKVSPSPPTAFTRFRTCGLVQRVRRIDLPRRDRAAVVTERHATSGRYFDASLKFFTSRASGITVDCGSAGDQRLGVRRRRKTTEERECCVKPYRSGSAEDAPAV